MGLSQFPPYLHYHTLLISSLFLSKVDSHLSTFCHSCLSISLVIPVVNGYILHLHSMSCILLYAQSLLIIIKTELSNMFRPQLPPPCNIVGLVLILLMHQLLLPMLPWSHIYSEYTCLFPQLKCSHLKAFYLS